MNKKTPTEQSIGGHKKEYEMRKVLLLLLAFICMMTACTTPASTETPDAEADGGVRGGFFLKGEIRAINENIEIEVIESDYAFGLYWVSVSDDTVYETKDGAVADKTILSVGDIVEVEYGGQVMMSYPPRIVAAKIRLLDA